MINGYDYLMLIDQDSTWQDFDKYKKMAIDFLSYSPDAIITPNINNSISKTCEVDTTISSGMFFSLATYSKTGNFEEKLFVEAVDLDYCLRARALNVKIIRIAAGTLYQQFGNTMYSKFLHCYTRNDSPERTYNIVFNHILIIKKYHKILYMYETKSYIWSYVFARFVKVVFLEKSKRRKCNAILKSCIASVFTPTY
jgi:rhamnosyltransferase